MGRLCGGGRIRPSANRMEQKKIHTCRSSRTENGGDALDGGDGGSLPQTCRRRLTEERRGVGGCDWFNERSGDVGAGKSMEAGKGQK
ncbi:hypothetical protein L2E82_10232 [Cichorium intybus]|uniref:Uncharacterized protein n=1 Tax=Cichorium intybus TaxID=13427 RepID=A0ACB9GB38_CICIN|nr:hypothetical protein L2E82_10232 [Cichorium intybus]